MTISLRDAEPGDADTIAAVYVASWNEGFRGLMPQRTAGPEQNRRWREELAGDVVKWRVAMAASTTLVGFAGTGPSRDPVDPSLGELDTIAVDPAYWRQGVGSRLMADALEVLAADFAAAILWTLEEYPAGDAFYRSHGWARDGGSRDSGRQVSYRRNLTDR